MRELLFVGRWLPVLVIGVLCWSVAGCHNECELVPIGTMVDGDTGQGDPDQNTTTDGDIFIPPADQDDDSDMTDADVDADDVESDGDSDAQPDGDVDGDWDYDYADFQPDGDLDWADGDVVEDDRPPEEKILPFDDRELLEVSPNGFWEYTMENGNAVATLRKNLEDEQPLFTNEGLDYTSNPPIEPSMIHISDRLAWAVYRPFNADGRVPEGDQVIIRKERPGAEIGTATITYHTVELPATGKGRLVQVGVLPTQEISDTSHVEFLAAYIWETTSSSAFLMVYKYRARLLSQSVSITQVGTEDYVRLPSGYRDRTRMRILSSATGIWINAGNGVHNFTNSGVYVASYPLQYGEGDYERFDVVDFALSPDGDMLSVIASIKLRNQERETVWLIHEIDDLAVEDPVVLVKEFSFEYEFDLYRTVISADGKYAFCINPDPNIFNDFYYMDLDSVRKRVMAVQQNSWGRPVALDNPSRLLLALPVSTDDFVTIHNRLTIRNVSEIVSGGQGVE